MRRLSLILLAAMPMAAAAQEWGIVIAHSESVFWDGRGGAPGIIPSPVLETTFGLTYRHHLASRVVLQPELHYVPRGEMDRFESGHVVLPIMLRVGNLAPDRGRIAPVISIGIAPAMQITCQYQQDGGDNLRACNDVVASNDYRLRRFDLGLVGAVGLEARAVGWLAGPELRTERGLRGVRSSRPGYQNRAVQLMLHLKPGN